MRNIILILKKLRQMVTDTFYEKNKIIYKNIKKHFTNKIEYATILNVNKNF